MIHHDLNVDESGRRALDGIIANVAGAMLGEFNDRFGQNSKDRPEMMDVFLPFQVEPRGGLKVFYTNTGFEYHRGDASLIHTDPAGTRDVEHGPDVRVYHWSGTEHGLGIWPPADAATVAADPRGWTERARNLRGVVNYGRLLRAALAQPRSLGHGRRAAAAEPSPADRRRHRRRSVRARDHLRQDPRGRLSAASGAGAAPGLLDAAPKPGPRLWQSA